MLPWWIVVVLWGSRGDKCKPFHRNRNKGQHICNQTEISGKRKREEDRRGTYNSKLTSVNSSV